MASTGSQLLRWAILLLALSGFSGSRLAAAGGDPIRVVVTIPDLMDVVRRVGGERVQVYSIARGTENIHAVALRPSALVQVSKADLFVEMGLSLEHAYVPGLLESGRNPKLVPGLPGFLNVSEGWEPVDVPVDTSRRVAADIHPQGNPHFNLSLGAGRHMTERILAGLTRLEPASEPLFQRNAAVYLAELEKAEARWRKAASEYLDGVAVAAFHTEFRYFALDTGLEVPVLIEPSPGVPPAPKDLAQSIQVMREKGIGVILTARWSNNDAVRFVAEKTGAKIVEVPVMCVRDREPTTWIGMMDRIFDSLREAVEE